MPRAHRYYLSHRLWHITHRCHERTFLLKFARDRQRYLHWLFEARKRYDLQVLGYTVTSNHVHLLAYGVDENAIARSVQLAAGRTAQEFNYRKGRTGAFWEDRYHATAIEADEHLHRCLVYIDLNMVRAGAVRHPADWPHCSYAEIQSSRQRYRIVDLRALSALCGFPTVERFRFAHRSWVNQALSQNASERDPLWSDSIAIGTHAFVATIQAELGANARFRQLDRAAGATYTLRESHAAYGPARAT